jgi:hypothetical protein
MKSVRLFLMVFLVVAVSAPAVFAAEFGVRAGRYNDAEDEFVGGEVAWDMGNWTFNPNIEYVLADNDDFGVDDVTLLTGNFDVVYNFGSSSFRPFVGAGLGVSYFSVEDEFLGDFNETDPLVNAIAGVKWDLDFLTPYAQLKYFRLLDDDDEGETTGDDIALVIGLRF